MAKSNKTIYVAMSGGVDSSVAAALLVKARLPAGRQGFNVVGVFMKPWQTPGVQCLWQKDREDAMRAAAVLGIPLETWDFAKEYGQKVAQDMIAGYRRGITPNPDVLCNKEIKFGLFFKKALAKGADFISTGHYARTKNGKLSRAKDSNKDQTYFLWTLGTEQLKKTLFPVGKYTKPQVRVLAKKFGLANHAKKDSQGVCFVGPMDVKDFLKTQIKSKKGKIQHLDGRVLGQHDGAAYYTIGQRHGLDIKDGGGPYYIVSKNIKKNLIVVGQEKNLYGIVAKVADLHWIGQKPRFPLTVLAKIRYRTLAQKATLSRNGVLKFAKPQRAITPGQSAVFYHKNQVLGGGIIV